VSYLYEIFRTLKPGGIVRLQFNGYARTLIERHLKRPLVMFLGAIGIKRMSFLFRGYYDTWVGMYLSKKQMRRILANIGFADIRIIDLGGTDVWAEAMRPAL
jgi:hypothetical protein